MSLPAGALTVDLSTSVDGWAGSEGLPAYFGYQGPDLEEWIRSKLTVPQLMVMGRRTYEAMTSIPEGPHPIVCLG